MSKPEDVRALIVRAREIASNASPGPWEILHPRPDNDDCDAILNAKGERIVETDTGVYGPSMADATLITESRTLVPQLADACEQLLSENVELNTTIDRTLAERFTAVELLPKALDLVRRLQWAGGGVRGDNCYLCGANRPGLVGPSQHAPDCPIAALGVPADDE